ncbi:MAG: PUA domain-containing protein, partial [Sphaerochaetaceae bacterium]
KIMAAQIALRGGTTCVIANGKTENVIERILKNESLGTCFHPTVKLSQRERWIMNNTHSGSITVDEGAYKALLNNNSLLAKGVIKVEGTFDKNEVVKVLKEDSSLFAKALVGFSSNELVQIMGHNSNEANKILNHDVKKVVFRPEDMVFIKG